MGIELARAFVTVRGDASRVGSDLNAARPAIESSVQGIVQSLGGIRGALMSIAGASAAIGAIWKAGKFEQTQIAFQTMIGSASETRTTLAALTDFAARTPFEMPEIEQAARGLIMFGERGDELMDTLKLLGNAASGTSTPFGMIALIFNQVRGVGKLLTQDFRQLSTRGVLSLQDIAKYYGVTTEAAQQMLSGGKITFEDLKGLLRSLSSEGGRFANMMEKQSRSFLGLWSTLKDDLGITARQIGDVLLPTAKDLVQLMIMGSSAVRNWIQDHKALAEIIIKLAAAWGVYKAAIIAATIALGIYKQIANTIPVGKVKPAAMAGSMAGTAAASAAGSAAGSAAPSLWSWASSGSVAASAGAEKIAAAPAAGLSTTLALGAAWAVVVAEVGVLIYELYDLFKSWRTINDEKKKSIALDEELTKSVAAHRKAYEDEATRQANATPAYQPTSELRIKALRSQEKKNQARELSEAEVIDAIRQTQRETKALSEGWDESTTSLDKFIQEHKYIKSDEVTAYTNALNALGEAKANKELADIQYTLNSLVGRWGDAEKATMDWAKANQRANQDQVELYYQLQQGMQFQKIQNELQDLSASVDTLAWGFDTAGRKTFDWARANKTATQAQIDQYQALQIAMEEVQAVDAAWKETHSVEESANRINTLVDAFNYGRMDAETLERSLMQEKGKFGQSWAFTGSVGAGDLGRQIQDAMLKPTDKTLAEAKEQNQHLRSIDDLLKFIKDKKGGLV
jgi:tape measure domain-containing protein